MIQQRNSRTATRCVLLCLWLSACAPSPDVERAYEADVDDVAQDPTQRAILEYFQAHGAHPDDVEFREDAVVVEGDMVFPYEQLEQLMDSFALSSAAEPAAGTDLVEKGYWGGGLPVNTFPVCIDNQLDSTWSFAMGVAAIRWSQAAWDGLDSNIWIVSSTTGCSSFNSNQIITARYKLPSESDPGFADATGPWSPSPGVWAPGTTLRVNRDTLFSETAESIVHGAIHEIGHTLGFAHPGVGGWIFGTASGGDSSYETIMRSASVEKWWYLKPDDNQSALVAYPDSCGPFNQALPDANFCSPSCPCNMGEGDCDAEGTAQQCKYGLVCGTNNGATYGLPSTYDVCTPPSWCPQYNPAVTDWDFCVDWGQCPCGPGAGDCDGDHECGGALVCGTDNGPAVGKPVGFDVCKLPPTPGCGAYSPGVNRCTLQCRCRLGEGDCDANLHCREGLVCAKDVGADFGLDSSWDVCVLPGTYPDTY